MDMASNFAVPYSPLNRGASLASYSLANLSDETVGVWQKLRADGTFLRDAMTALKVANPIAQAQQEYLNMISEDLVKSNQIYQRIQRGSDQEKYVGLSQIR